jgi:hypothetical protein
MTMFERRQHTTSVNTARMAACREFRCAEEQARAACAQATTSTGFEPARAEPDGFQGRLLDQFGYDV